MKWLLTLTLVVSIASPATASTTGSDPAPAVPVDDLGLPEPECPGLLPPEPVERGCYLCAGAIRTTSPGGGAASHWGMGASCTAAQAHLENQLNLAALDFCNGHQGAGAGFCNVVVVVTAACYWSPQFQTYVVEGYANFKCQYFIC